MPNLILDEMSWTQINEHLKDIRAALVPVGSSEQHGPHLPMSVDTVCATTIAKLVGEQLYPHALVATPIPIGVSFHHMRFAGTLTLREDTFIGVVEDVCWSLAQHGIRNIVLINGHWGNISPLMIATRKVVDNLGVRCFFLSHWDYVPERCKSLVDDGFIPGHAAEFETSMTLYANPSHVNANFKRTHKPKLTPELWNHLRSTNPKKLFDLTEDGILLGDPNKASSDKGERLARAISEEIATLIKKEFAI